MTENSMKINILILHKPDNNTLVLLNFIANYTKGTGLLGMHLTVYIEAKIYELFTACIYAVLGVFATHVLNE